MEEQKSKEVKMNTVANQKKQTGEGETSLIEELKTWPQEKLIQQVVQMNQQLFNQDNYINRMRDQITEMRDFIQNKRIDFLFKVVEISSNEKPASEYPCFAKDFVEKCIAELQDTLTIPEAPKDNTPKDN